MTNFKSDLTDKETTRLVKAFSKWEKSNLTIVYGTRYKSVLDTYGLPYTSSSDYAMLGNCNCKAVFNGNNDYELTHIAMSEDGDAIAVLEDNEENTIYIMMA